MQGNSYYSHKTRERKRIYGEILVIVRKGKQNGFTEEDLNKLEELLLEMI